ncbi:MAG: transcription-repair coupling factor, partial [Bdellovibrionales bacterium]|nr:transcription-repair coupling factor [Bdellovibrionales bacterium]
MDIETLPFQSFQSLERALRTNAPYIRVTGTHSSVYLAALACHSCLQNSHRPILFVFAHAAAEQSFQEALAFFDPTLTTHSLPAFDVSPYSHLYPNRNKIGERLFWLYRAQSARPGEIFTASVEALCQNTIPQELFLDLSFSLKVGDDLPHNFSQQLETLGYMPSPTVESYGQYAIRGGIVDIFPTSSTTGVRLELFGDTIDSMRTFDPESQRSSSTLSIVDIPPAREVLFIEDHFAEFIQRLTKNWKDRPVQDRDKQEIIHQLQRRHYFHGLEFLLPFAYEHLQQPLHFFMSSLQVFFLDPTEIKRSFDDTFSHFKSEADESQDLVI